MKNELRKRLLILSCSARKSDARVCNAIDRYNSPSFFLLRRYLKNNPENDLVIWILSARYGLIGSRFRIETYDTAMTPERAAQLGEKIGRQFQKLYGNNFEDRAPRIVPSEVFCHLPRYYRDALAVQLETLGRIAEVKFAAGRPGEKLRDLKNWLEEKQEVYADNSRL